MQTKLRRQARSARSSQHIRTAGITGLVSLACIITMATGGTNLASASTSRDVTLMVGGYEVVGRFEALVDVPRLVNAELRDSDGTVRATTEVSSTIDGTVALSFRTTGPFPRQPVRLHSGDLVIIDLGDAESHALTYTVGVLNVEADPVADVLRGTAPPEVEVRVTARHGDQVVSRAVSSDVTGRWQADLGDEIDLGPGSHGIVMWGEQVQTSYTAYQANWLVRDVKVQVGASAVRLPARPGESATARVVAADGSKRSEGRAVAWANEMTLWLHDAGGDAVPLAPGDQLRITLDREGDLVFDVPALDVVVRPETNDVVGFAPPTARVTVSADGEEASTTADTDGQWLVSFAGSVEITLDTVVHVRLRDTAWASLSARASQLVHVDPIETRVRVAGTGGAPVAIEIHDASDRPRGSARGHIPADGSDIELTTVDALGNVLRWLPNDRLVITNKNIETVIRCHPLEAAAHADGDTVSGTTVPNATLSVAAGATTREVNADEDGRWLVSFAGQVDLTPGMPIDVTIDGSDGFRSSMSFPVFVAGAQVAGSRVLIGGPPGLHTSLEVTRDGSVVANSTCIVARDRCTATVRDASGRLLALRPDDTVTLTPDGGSAAALDVVRLTASIDLSGRDVVGEAPPHSEVHVSFEAAPGGTLPLLIPRGAAKSTRSAGMYDYELLGSEMELLAPGLITKVSHVAASGHYNFAVGAVEVVRASPGDELVRGVAEPGSAVTATLRSTDGAEMARGGTVAGDDGVFEIALTDAYDVAVPLGAAGRLTVEHRRGKHVLELAQVVAWRHGAAGTLLGTSRPHAPVLAIHHIGTDPDSVGHGGTFVVASGSVEAGGFFELPLPHVDRSRERGVELVVALPSGDELRTWADSDEPPGRAFLPWSKRP